MKRLPINIMDDKCRYRTAVIDRSGKVIRVERCKLVILPMGKAIRLKDGYTLMQYHYHSGEPVNHIRYELW